MDANRSRSLASPDLAREAESLVRCLTGVTAARVHAGDSGIDAIHVEAADDHAASALAGHVRSALLAGLATPVVPARIHVRVAQPAGPADSRIRLLETQDGKRARAAAVEPDDEDASPQPGRDLEPPFSARPRLVSVDLERRPDDRLVCRVAIALGADIYRAEALAVDLPGAAGHAAAQAAVRALVLAGVHGLELAGLREVEIAGRQYVVVALNRSDPTRRFRSGSTPILGSAERSAAEATVVAAHDLI